MAFLNLSHKLDFFVDKDFWISKILKKDLFEITDPETSRSIIVKNLQVENPKTGKCYFVALVRDKRIVLESKKYFTPNPEKPESTIGPLFFYIIHPIHKSTDSPAIA